MKTSLVLLYTVLATPAFADDEAPATDEAPIADEAPAEEPADPAPEAAPSPDPWDTASGEFTATKLPVLFPSRNPGPTYTHAISLQLATADPSSLAVQFERASKRWPKTSVALAVGGRSSAQGEYSSHTAGVGIEVKRWLRRPQPMTGLYLGARTDLARTTTHDVMEDRDVGKMTTWTTGLSVGYRWVLFHRVELTPSIGAAMVVEGGTMSPTTVRGAGTLGLTAGYTW